MNISFFARPYFFGEDFSIASGLFLHRGSSLIRGEQIAEFLGAKYNPTSGYENDLCIYIKPKRLDYVKDNSYVDIVDGDYLIKPLHDRPKIKVITSTKSSYELLRKILKNEIFFIPQQHCNFERVIHKRGKITTGGFLSHPSASNYSDNNEIRKQLKKIGLRFITCFNFKSRQDVVDFYKQIDFQIIGHFGRHGIDNPFAHPLKIINAASFGIPTIAAWMTGYKEFKKFFVPVLNMDCLIAEVEKMKNEVYYDQWSDRIIDAAEKYHISKIAEKYRKLK